MVWKFMRRKKAVGVPPVLFWNYESIHKRNSQTGWVYVYHPSEIGNYRNWWEQFPFTCAFPTPPVIPQEKENDEKSTEESRVRS